MRVILPSILIAAASVFSSVGQAAPQIGFLLNHGIQEEGTGQNLLQSFLTNQYCPGSNCVDNSTYGWYARTLPQQAAQISPNIETLRNNIGSPGSAPIVLIGHSQGGLRVRQWAEFTGQGQAARAQVAGLITIGTPNSGAPVGRNGPGTVAYATTSIGAGLGAFFGPFGVLIGGGAGSVAGSINGFLDAFNKGFTGWYGGAATPDMTPGSQFLADLNNAPRQNCWTVYWTVRVYFMWWSWTEQRSRIDCQTITPTNRLPNNIPTLSLVGQNGDFDSYFNEFGVFNPSIRVFRDRQAVLNTFLATGAWALAVPTFGASVPSAIAWTNLAYFWADLPGIWARAIGSYQSDAFMPESSQRMKFSDVGITNGYSYTENLPSAHHTGWCGEVTGSSDAMTNGTEGNRGYTSCTGKKPDVLGGSSSVKFESGANLAIRRFVRFRLGY